MGGNNIEIAYCMCIHGGNGERLAQTKHSTLPEMVDSLLHLVEALAIRYDGVVPTFEDGYLCIDAPENSSRVVKIHFFVLPAHLLEEVTGER